MHPRVDAALVEDRVTDIVRAFGVCEERIWGNYACQRWGRENDVPIGTDLPAAALWHDGGRASELVQQWHDAPTKLLDFRERVRLAANVRGDELLPNGDAALARHELPFRSRVQAA